MRLLIRADATAEIGTGHVMRMIALAERVSADGGECLLLSVGLDEAVERRVLAHGIAVRCDRDGAPPPPGSDEDVRRLVSAAADFGCDWIVADGYAFDDRFQDAIREAGIRLLLVDDHGHCRRYSARIVLNPNLLADERLYRERSEQTRLRPEARRADLRITRILVTLGGSDAVNATERVLRACAFLDDRSLRFRVVIGPSNRNAARLAERVTDPRVEFVHDVAGMAELMNWADLAIAGAGITTQELCFIGVPALLVVLADNQLEVARTLDREGICENLGWHHDLDPRQLAERVEDLSSLPVRRQRMIDRARRQFDGRGAARVAAALRAIG